MVVGISTTRIDEPPRTLISIARSTAFWTSHHPARVAFALALVFGLGLAIFQPALKGADERDQFARAYQISTGDLLTNKVGSFYGAYLPQSYNPEMSALTQAVYLPPNGDKTAFLNFWNQPAPSGPPTFVEIGTIASYGPGGYVVFSPVIALGRIFGASLLVLIYLARFAGVLAFAGLLALSVKRLPVHKWVLVAGGLIPETLNQGSTVTADSLTTGLTFLIVAEALRLSLDSEVRPKKILVESAVAAFCLALAKPPYILFVLMFLIPAWRYRERLLRPLVGIVAGSLLATTAWVSYQRRNSMRLDLKGFWPPYFVTNSQYAYRHIDIAAQTHYVIVHPFSFLAVLWRTFFYQGQAFPKMMLGLLSLYQIPTLLILLVLVILACSCLTFDVPPRFWLPRIDRILLVTLSLMIAVGVCAIVYTSANAFHAPRIDQLTPRYMLALIPPFLIGVLPQRQIFTARVIQVLPLITTILVGVLWVGVLAGLQQFQFG